MTAADPVRTDFAVIGSGWRSLFFLRIARELPERFRVVGLVTRSDATGANIESAWGVPTYRTIDQLLNHTMPKFAVVSVPRTVAPETITRLAGHGVPVLTETPPGPDVESMLPLHQLVADGALIQVAEQYHLSPLLAAQLAIARSGKLGEISQATVAQCHDYHGVSLIRRALGVGFSDVRISASAFESPLVQGPDRTGDPTRETRVTSHQITARLDFGGQLGVYDFANEHYRSWIRANRLLIRGDRGEINNHEVSYLQDFRTPIFSTISRVDTGVGGNLEGKFLRGLICGDEWVYRNQFMPARLMDDELAIAECLARMSDHVDGGPEFYSLAEASQDHYLQLLMRQAVATGEVVTSSRQPWAP
ncbi:Gfo/Idh/MocA family oxidoreductase [Arthrobacter sp. 260]|uniref:Gfo/Idh/MocA family oxidoreductase n=1 Tax=Arthrobacter sp. 260 TaxID=2735314 RepID=UPI001491F950|nr:Gfo/Idh/MocA family oxidoreductase [Arthrobacter sp. 260]